MLIPILHTRKSILETSQYTIGLFLSFDLHMVSEGPRGPEFRSHIYLSLSSLVLEI